MEVASSRSSNLIFDPLHQDSFTASLKILIKIIGTCIGPQAKLKLLRHEEGGSVILTSSSQRLFQFISVKNIFSKIIISAAKSQLKSFNDGGLFCVILILKTIHHALSSESPLPIIGTIYEYYATLYIECLNYTDNLCVRNVDFSNFLHLRSIVHSILSSKPGCVLTLENKNHLTNLILEAYLTIVPPPSTLLDDYNIRILNLESFNINHSKLFKGVLIPLSKVDGNCFQNKRNENGPFRIVLFTTSLAGDADLPVKHLEISTSFSVADFILKYLEGIIQKVILGKYDFLFCQKVIHPKLKKQLRNAGILFLDRLGVETTKYIQIISGGSANTSLASEISYGTVSSFKIEEIERKTFLLLNNEEIPVVSLVLGHYNAEASKELQVVCRQAISALFRILKSNRVCLGGGCTEVYTAHLWSTKVKSRWTTIQNEMGCTQGQLQESYSLFLKSVTDVCVANHQGSQLDFVTEHVHGHLWKMRDDQFPSGDDQCACGFNIASDIDSWSFLSDIGKSSLNSEAKTAENCKSHDLLVLDELSCKASALTLAFETASLLLRSSVCVNNLH
ncbi:molecular chaperone MKKS-like [Argiope bruennichi]|uniref:molecular chaperone MKKS-like n=1 Tax=Argiope bruennichi TaxID=94029 RepID=UPI00249506AE|nr:molecular chaperone MKKS-like [Argiope bruennichi]XP_055943010.1 molecular chaperone MKKS-like [Argiope bruennichi]